MSSALRATLRRMLPGAVALIVVAVALILFAVYANRQVVGDQHPPTTTTTTSTTG